MNIEDYIGRKLHPDQIKRETVTHLIPYIYELDYGPAPGYLLVHPIDGGEQKKVGSLILPDKAVRPVYEGHVVKVGDGVEGFGVGDCISWQAAMETIITIDERFKVACIAPSTVLLVKKATDQMKQQLHLDAPAPTLSPSAGLGNYIGGVIRSAPLLQTPIEIKDDGTDPKS